MNSMEALKLLVVIVTVGSASAIVTTLAALYGLRRTVREHRHERRMEKQHREQAC
jgi:hypothetical protein